MLRSVSLLLALALLALLLTRCDHPAEEPRRPSIGPDSLSLAPL